MENEDLKNILARRLNKYGLAKQLDSYRIVEIANQVLNGRATALSVSRGILTVECSDNIKAQELQFSAHLIIKEINQKLSQSVIKRFSYRIRQI